MEAPPEAVWDESTTFERVEARFGRGHHLEVYESGWHARHLEGLESIVEA